jgi:hypothetical protein
VGKSEMERQRDPLAERFANADAPEADSDHPPRWHHRPAVVLVSVASHSATRAQRRSPQSGLFIVAWYDHAM